MHTEHHGGERGIRTLGSLFWEITFLAGRRFRPTQPFLQEHLYRISKKLFRARVIFWLTKAYVVFIVKILDFIKKSSLIQLEAMRKIAPKTYFQRFLFKKLLLSAANSVSFQLTLEIAHNILYTWRVFIHLSVYSI